MQRGRRDVRLKQAGRRRLAVERVPPRESNQVGVPAGWWWVQAAGAGMRAQAGAAAAWPPRQARAERQAWQHPQAGSSEQVHKHPPQASPPLAARGGTRLGTQTSLVPSSCGWMSDTGRWRRHSSLPSTSSGSAGGGPQGPAGGAGAVATAPLPVFRAVAAPAGPPAVSSSSGAVMGEAAGQRGGLAKHGHKSGVRGCRRA